MNHNNPLPPLWQEANTGGVTPRANSTNNNAGNTSKITAGNISSVKYVTNARSSMKIINIPSQQPSVTATNDGTLLYGTPIGGSYLTVTNEQRQSQQPQQPRRSTTTTTTHAAMLNESILLQTPDGREYLVDERSIQNIDQIPPENLIYMTASETLSVVDADDVSQLSIVDQSHLELHDYVDTVEPAEPIDQMQQQQQLSTEAQYTEECEVTEEVITDDWVQPQGEECVQVTVDQLGVSTVVVEEDDISVPLDQDQYTLSRPYPCDFCSRRFRKKSSLQNHLMAHSNDRPHFCNLCGAQYGHRADLINHLKQHAYSVTDQDELSLRSDQEAEYDLPDLSNATAGHSMKHRVRHSSEDEDMYIQNSMVSYNSQPPMQLISTTNYGASATTTSAGPSSYGHNAPMVQTSYNDGDIPAVEPKYILGEINPSAATPSSTGAGKRTQRKKTIPSTDTRTARTKPAFSSKAPRSNVSAANRQIKKEPTDNAESAATTDWRKPFVCEQCGASFARAKALLSHSRSHAGNKRYDCVYCDAHFWEHSLLQDHVSQAHAQQPQQSSSVEGGGRLESWISDHEPYAHGTIELPVVTTKQYNCDSCDAVFFQLEHLLNHAQHAHGTGYESSTIRNVNVKQELLHTSGNTELDSDREAEATDQEDEEEEEDEEEYDGLDYTIEHYENRANESELRTQSPLTCRDCGETFETAMDLLDHSEVHSGRYEPLECQLCGEKFLDEANIKQHVQDRHRSELTATSCAICGKRCKSQTTLMKHAWDHSRERTHSCSKCGKTFHHMTRLKRHMDSHRNKAVRCEADAKRGSPDQPYYCTVCSSPFTTTADLVQHLIEHSDTNTAMKRKPPTFPRKYKRRRKLKPHELERLQSGRRKQKSKRQFDNEDEEEEEHDENAGGSGFEEATSAQATQSVGQQRRNSKSSAIVRSHPDGTLKTTRELYLEYGRSAVARAPKSSSVSSTQGMLDDNGINLLSNVVLLHGQQQGESSKLHNNNHLPESPQPLHLGETPAKSKQTPGSSRMIYTQKSKPVPKRKTSSRKRPAKEQHTVSSPAVKVEPDEDPTMANAMEAFFRGRKRNASLLPEIPPHRISSVGFPLLDDGNTDDPMDEPEQPARRSTASFSASEDDLLNQQLLMEISHKNKYTDRFNSDTVNDLEEILRSPVKSVATAMPAAKSATTITSATSNKKQQQQGGKKTANQRKRTVASKAKPKAKNKPTSQLQKQPAEKKTAPEPPTVLRSQRLTRRQLEREVNFLKEAYETDPVNNASGAGSATTNCASTSGTVIKLEATDKRASVDGMTDALPDRLDSSERLAAMLLNDGLPGETEHSSSSGESSRATSVSSRPVDNLFASESYAEGMHMMDSESAVKQEEQEDADLDFVDEIRLDYDDTTTSATAPGSDEPMHRCSICAACFDDRALLILHVPVHI
uniref:C2H2-type domain-containing protein n=1 Tax=Anopheles christyi TaxID=43041 RepID=A0A182K5V5_9DIPT